VTDRRLRLELLSIHHIDHIMGWINDLLVTRNFQRFGAGVPREEELQFISRISVSDTDRVFSLFDAETGSYIGQAGLNQISWENKLGRLALIISQGSQRQGYGRNAIETILTYAFAELKLNKVWLMVYETNERSRRIYGKAGFKEEGLLREEYFWHGEYHNMVRMAVLKNEWELIKVAG